MARRIVPSVPLKKQIAKEAPIDTTGMDPEMAATLRGERNRRGVVGKVTAPFVPKGKAVKKKP